jgi:ribosomal protein S18 acetylase RimI-like enzyme
MDQVSLRASSWDDAAFLYHLLKASMQSYVAQTWGWDEQWQQAYFQKTFDPARNQIIVMAGQDVGVISVEKGEQEVFLSRLYILPEYQGRGIGTQLIKRVLAEAFGDNLPVSLRVLRVNPAKELYERLGFVVVEETDVRYLMKATPPQPQT